MIVGASRVDKQELVLASTSVQSFEEFCVAQVPDEFKHCREIVDNQKYLCCIILRSIKTVPWDKKKPVIDDVMRGLSIVGFTDTLVEATSLLGVANLKRVKKFKERGL